MPPKADGFLGFSSKKAFPDKGRKRLQGPCNYPLLSLLPFKG
jgi:hypothetical protein